MESIIENLNNILNTVYGTTYDDILNVRDELIGFNQNLLESLERLDPINGLDDIMEDIDILIQKINGEIEW